MEELDRAGVLADCRRIGTFGTSLAWRKVTGEPIVELKRTPTSHEPYENLVLGQHELAEVIGNHFKACENSQILFEHSVVAIEQDDKGITARVETPEGERTFTASYLVGADGGKSTIRRVTGVSFEGFTWREQIVATNVVYPFEEYGYSAGNQIVYVCLTVQNLGMH